VLARLVLATDAVPKVTLNEFNKVQRRLHEIRLKQQASGGIDNDDEEENPMEAHGERHEAQKVKEEAVLNEQEVCRNAAQK